MERFASGWKRHYYGKKDVTAYRLTRQAPASPGRTPVFGASVSMLTYGEAFWPTYTTGDNTGLVATDSMKNFIQRETLNFDGDDVEGYARFLAELFLATYPQAEGVQLTATEVPYAPAAGGAFTPAGPERAMVRLEVARSGIIEAVSGMRGFRLLRLGGSAFHGFVRDEYTTLPDQIDRPLHMWLDLEWSYVDPQAAFSEGRIARQARQTVHDVFGAFQSGSIQQVIHQVGTRLLDDLPAVEEVHLEAQNRTWDTVAERGGLGVYTDPRPAYGCLGLRVRR
jgi:urate oxidase/2-oxo-4-hydroxy-4-carboxy-5-ureidoimidazoline decarboxylase